MEESTSPVKLRVAHVLEVLAFWASATAAALRSFNFHFAIFLALSAAAIAVYGATYYIVFRKLDIETKSKHCYFNNFCLTIVAPLFALYPPFGRGACLAMIFVSLVIIYRSVTRPGGHPAPLSKKFWNRKIHEGF
ncbi:hypothetical protein [Mobiluncus mulieris]|uniref:hypothetical protein n=1 Tax=Mobiluncus mulieris TaxID=2052 RepID=UPI002432F57D|nr:hypothetical protein [Mobiluncus mulieris]